MAYNLIVHPNRYDVIVTTNLFGDILSDMAAALVGGLGLVPSANIGKEHAFFEPVHGSAPDIAGKGIANPIAAILSMKMMLEWYELTEQAKVVQDAIEYSINQKMVTSDLGGKATTKEVGEAIADRVRQLID
jgi:methanogen homoisocitrate dehydrogenase